VTKIASVYHYSVCMLPIHVTVYGGCLKTSLTQNCQQCSR